MKLSELKTNQHFKSYSGVTFIKLAMSETEQKRHNDRYKAQRLDTKEIFYLTDMIIIKTK